MNWFELVERPEWMQRGACRDMDANLFFPGRGESTAKAKKAKQVCASCPVQAECLAYAMNTGEKYGIWGGMSEKQRRQLRSRRRTPRATVDHAEVAAIANAAPPHARAAAVAAHYGIGRDAASHRISAARAKGHAVARASEPKVS